MKWIFYTQGVLIMSFLMKRHTNRLNSNSTLLQVQPIHPIINIKNNNKLIEEINTVERHLRYFKKKYPELDQDFKKFQVHFASALQFKRKPDDRLNDIFKKIPWNDTNAKNAEQLKGSFALSAMLFIVGIGSANITTIFFVTITLTTTAPPAGLFVLGAALVIVTALIIAASITLLINACIEKEKITRHDELYTIVNDSESEFNQYLADDTSNELQNVCEFSSSYSFTR